MADDVGDGMFDSWETLLDSGALDKKIDELKIRAAPPAQQCEPAEPHGTFVPVILHEDNPRTPYAPPQPQVKILKRPSAGADGSGLANGEKVTKQPPKSLQQREAEYAEARLRILGAAKNEEDIVEERLEKIMLAAPVETAKAGASEATPPTESARCSEPELSADGAKRPCGGVALIRQPRGPDGTSGFTAMR